MQQSSGSRCQMTDFFLWVQPRCLHRSMCRGCSALCGIPTRNLDGSKLPLDQAGSKKLATYAVKHIYQFTPSRKEYEATAYQKFLLQTRDRLAIRFRMDCASFDPEHPIHPNTYPYFVGAFDTVAALGSLAQGVISVALYAVLAATASWLISLIQNLPISVYTCRSSTLHPSFSHWSQYLLQSRSLSTFRRT